MVLEWAYVPGSSSWARAGSITTKCKNNQTQSSAQEVEHAQELEVCARGAEVCGQQYGQTVQVLA